MNDVEKRFVDLANVVEERDPLDVPERPLVETGGVGENECITSDAADVSTGLCVVGVDSAQQRFEHGGGETFRSQAALPLAHEQHTAGCSSRKPEVAKHGVGRKEKAGHPIGWPA